GDLFLQPAADRRVYQLFQGPALAGVGEDDGGELLAVHLAAVVQDPFAPALPYRVADLRLPQRLVPGRVARNHLAAPAGRRPPPRARLCPAPAAARAARGGVGAAAPPPAAPPPGGGDPRRHSLVLHPFHPVSSFSAIDSTSSQLGPAARSTRRGTCKFSAART